MITCTLVALATPSRVVGRRRLACLLPCLLLAIARRDAVSQGVITLRADSVRRVIAPSSSLAVPLIVDMLAAGGANIATLTAGVTFGATRLAFDSVRAPFGWSAGWNATNASNGSLTLFIGGNAAGTTTTQTLATVYFTTAATTGGTTVGFSPAAAGAASGTNILALIGTRPLDVCVPAGGGLWGDVNGDSAATPTGDGNVNVIDAQQIARFSVALTVSNRPGIVARGDVTNDGSVNIVDAQQIARFSVGLAAAARVNTASLALPTVNSVTLLSNTLTVTAGHSLQLNATARDAANELAVQCAAISYFSSDTTKAKVSGSGLVSAVAAGTATITASSGGKSATASVTVAPVILTLAVNSGNGQTAIVGTPVFSPPSVKVSDQDGSGVQGVAVSFAVNSGGGSVGGASQVTDTSGLASPVNWTVGPAVGANSLTASSSGLTSVSFAAEGVRVVSETRELGAGSSCELTSAGTAYCWGENEVGQLGDGTNTPSTSPVPVAGGLTFRSIDQGIGFTVALTVDGTAYAWGWNTYGQLGVGDKVNRNTPTLVAGGMKFKAISAGGFHTVALTTSGEAYAWGGNFDSQLGLGTSDTSAVLVPAAAAAGFAFETIIAGGVSTYGITASGTAYAWGNALNGILGIGPGLVSSGGVADRRSVPTLVAGGLAFVAIAHNSGSTIALSPSGRAYAWGHNGGPAGVPHSGLLGVGSDDLYIFSPTAVVGGLTFKSICAGSNWNWAALAPDGTAYAWGGSLSSLGNGGIGYFGDKYPRPVSGNVKFQSIACGSSHVMAVTTSGALWGWGGNWSGELGVGDKTDRLIPTLLPGGIVWK